MMRAAAVPLARQLGFASLTLATAAAMFSTVSTPTIAHAAAAPKVASSPCTGKIVEVTPDMPRSELYPPIAPYDTGRLRVSDLHELYYEQYGNPNGKPVVVLHGGPGGGSAPSMAQYFNPKKYRIIMFDQRGAGKSTPFAELRENDTWAIVNDIERLRKHLKVDKWLTAGGSWGSTAALAYATSHPDRVTELILRGIFLVRKQDIDFFYQQNGGASYYFPDEWEKYLAPIPEGERSDMVVAYNKRLTSSDPAEVSRAARAWTAWEMATSKLLKNQALMDKAEDDKFPIAFSRIENHFFVNKGFFPSDNYLIENTHKIRHIPTVIVHGRYDTVCPMKGAWDLKRAMPEADLYIIADSGHSMSEKGIISELVRAGDLFADRK